MDTINNYTDFMRSLMCDTEEELMKYLSGMDYPVTVTHDDKSVTLATDADRFPITKKLRFPFSKDYPDRALTELLCTTDYAMHEGYENTHKDLFKDLALRHAEKIGVYEYKVNGKYMEYWSLFDEGFYFFRTDLDTLERSEVCFLHWVKDEGFPVPAFLKTPEGFTKYNYFCG